MRLDLGVSLGLGASSGYTNFSAYLAAPFTPVWAFQLVPAVRGHAMATWALTPRLDLFVRAELASLLLGGNAIGSRVGNPQPPTRDTVWGFLWVGVALPL